MYQGPTSTHWYFIFYDSTLFPILYQTFLSCQPWLTAWMSATTQQKRILYVYHDTIYQLYTSKKFIPCHWSYTETYTVFSVDSSLYKTVQIKTSAPPFFMTLTKTMKTYQDKKTQLLTNLQKCYFTTTFLVPWFLFHFFTWCSTWGVMYNTTVASAHRDTQKNKNINQDIVI